MSAAWAMPPEPPAPRITPLGWLRVLARGAPMAVVVFGGLAVLLALRLVERPLYGLHRPLTPRITQGVCRAALAILGLGYTVRGERMQQRGAVVANHVSWLDIFVLNAGKRVYFVSKSEVARWPFIGWLARATGTVFIDRDPRAARAQTALFVARLMAGHKLLFFPEGTSTDGLVVLPFKPTLFEAFFRPGLHEALVRAAGDGGLPRARGSGRAVLRLVGRDGFRAPPAQGAGGAAAGPGRGDLPRPRRGGRFRRPQGAGRPCRGRGARRDATRPAGAAGLTARAVTPCAWRRRW